MTWHAPGKFDPASGERQISNHDSDRYQDVFGQVLLELAKADAKVVGVTPAMAKGCGMNLLAAELPGQFFDVGIEEEHAVTFSAGLAAGGMKPFCNIYSAFSQRAYDQIIHDVALQSLPVVLCFDRAGLVGEDGSTHNGVFDIAAYRNIPGTIIASPKDELELKQLMYTAYKHQTGPFIIRYPRGMGKGVDWKSAAFCELETGKAECLLAGSSVAVVCTGPVVYEALEAAKDFEGKVGVYNFRFVKPLDYAILDRIASRYSCILSVEDGCLKGGLYGAICEYVMEKGLNCAVQGIGVPDKFIKHARQADQLAQCGIDRKGIKEKLENIFENCLQNNK